MLDVSKVVFVESSYTGAGEACAAAARRLGMEPVLLTSNSDPYEFARRSGIAMHDVDTTSVDAIAEAVDELQGVVGVGTTDEYSTAVAAEVCDVLGLPGPDPNAVKACRDKYLTRLALPRSLSPAWHLADDPEQGAMFGESLGFPVVVKPSNLTGSIGVRKCFDAESVRRAVAALIERTSDRDTPAVKRVLVEEYIDGPEFSVEMFGSDIVGVTSKLVGGLEGSFVEVGHDFPAAIDDDALSALEASAREAMDALGMSWGPAHLELRVRNDTCKIMEVNARIPGDRIPRLIELTKGFSFAEAYVACIAGLSPPPPTASVADNASIRMWTAERTGLLVSHSAPAVYARVDPESSQGVREATFSGVAGSLYDASATNLERLGYVIAVGESAAIASSLANCALKTANLEWQ